MDKRNQKSTSGTIGQCVHYTASAREHEFLCNTSAINTELVRISISVCNC